MQTHPKKEAAVRAAMRVLAVTAIADEIYVIRDTTLCSNGFAVTSSMGRDGFVSAGHLGAAGAQVQTANGAPMGRCAASAFPGADSLSILDRYGKNPPRGVRGAV